MLLAAFYFALGIAVIVGLVKFGQIVVASVKNYNGLGNGKR